MVSGQTRRKTEEERDFRFGSAKMERDPFFAWSLSPVPRSLLSKLHRNACYAGQDSLSENRIDQQRATKACSALPRGSSFQKSAGTWDDGDYGGLCYVNRWKGLVFLLKCGD